MSAGKTGSPSRQSTSSTGDESATSSESFTDDESTEKGVSNLDDIGKTSREGGAELTKGEIFDLLKNRRRRTVIRYLRENDGYAELNDLAEHIAARENDIDVRQLSSDQRKRVYIGLYQCHLPKMDSLGVIDYDKDRGTIELQASVHQLLEYMDLNDDGQEETQERIGRGRSPPSRAPSSPSSRWAHSVSVRSPRCRPASGRFSASSASSRSSGCSTRTDRGRDLTR
jgi:hypothetical protein